MILADIWQNPVFVPIFISVVSGLLGAIILDIYIHIKKGTKKAVERRKKEKQDEFKEIVVPCIEEAIKPLSDKMTVVEKKVDTIAENDLPVLKQANRDSLRNQLFASYRYCRKTGFRSIEDTKNWESMYESYIALGGNGFIPELKTKFEAIPLEDLSLLKVVVNEQTKKQQKKDKK